MSKTEPKKQEYKVYSSTGQTSELIKLLIKYNVWFDKDAELLISTFGEYEEAAKAAIMQSYPPERAAELLKAKDELNELLEKIADIARTEGKQIQDADYLTIIHNKEFDAPLSLNGNMFRQNKDDVTDDGKLSIVRGQEEYVLMNIMSGVLDSRFLGTCAKKLYIYILYLIDKSYARSTTVFLNTTEYADLNNRDISKASRRDEFCKQIRNDLTGLASLLIPIKGGKTSVITGFKRAKGGYYIEIPPSTLEALRTNFIFENVPKCFFLLDNRKQNSFSIGLFLNMHYNDKGHRKNKTNTIISIKNLLERAPAIMSIKEYNASERRTFKEDMKTPLETSLNENIEIGFLSSWSYKEPGREGKTITQAAANSMSFNDWSKLNIEFCVKTLTLPHQNGDTSEHK